jgi:hypothetical protein
MRRRDHPSRVTPTWWLAGGALMLLTACRYNTTLPSTDSSSSTTSSGTTTVDPATLTYTTDVAPILAADCVRCHTASRGQGGVDLSSYQAVLRQVTPGNANSLLVLVTQPGGLMYGQFSGNRTAKATTIRDWIVSARAAQ